MLKFKCKGKIWMSYLKGLRLISRLNLTDALDVFVKTVALQLHICKVPCSAISLDTSYSEHCFLWLFFNCVAKHQDSALT